MILTDAALAHYTIGHKAHGLYRLRAAGMAVPDFLVIPAEVFDAALRPVSPAPDAATAAQQRQLLAEFELSAADQQAITQALASWQFPAQPVVVRSSVADEDGVGTSFPGLMDSFLNLTSEAAVWAAPTPTGPWPTASRNS
jgi:phosphoenolpyruvate synthase/pyruvate phosphate dikinase